MILYDFFRDMLEEEDVIDSMLNSSVEEIPYFAMLTNNEAIEDKGNVADDTARPGSNGSSHIYGWEEIPTPVQEEVNKMIALLLCLALSHKPFRTISIPYSH